MFVLKWVEKSGNLHPTCPKFMDKFCNPKHVFHVHAYFFRLFQESAQICTVISTAVIWFTFFGFHFKRKKVMEFLCQTENESAGRKPRVFSAGSPFWNSQHQPQTSRIFGEKHGRQKCLTFKPISHFIGKQIKWFKNKLKRLWRFEQK